MTEHGEPGMSVLRDEEFDVRVDQLLALARKLGATMRDDRIATTPPSEERDIMPMLRDDLRAALEDEIVPAVSAGRSSVIRLSDLSHEVIKKALVGLKVPALREIARAEQLQATGGREALATEIARHYGWDEEQVARLVLEHEEEPRPETGHVDRLFPLAQPPDLDDMARHLEYVLNRYIRIGIARWFVFDRVEVKDGTLTLAGTLHAYQAHVNASADRPSLAAVPSEHHAEAHLVTGENVVQVRGGTATDARACVRALQIVARLQPLGYVPLRGNPHGASVGLDPSSLFMLDLLANRLPSSGMRDLNLTVARFRVTDAESEDSEGEVGAKPTLKAVRFEGTHLLDSAAACKLLAEESRALVDVALRLTQQSSDESSSRGDATSPRFLVRFALERDHALVMTGYGTRQPELSSLVHRSLREALTSEIRDGFLSPTGLADLSRRIRARASSRAPDRADMFGQPEGTDTSPSL